MSRGDATNHVLLPFQGRWVGDMLDPRIHFLLCEKSRRVGITWATGAGAVLLAAGLQPQDVWYIGYKEGLALEFVNDCADWASKLQRAVSVRRGGLRIVLCESGGAEGVPMPTVVNDRGEAIGARPGVHAVMHRVIEEVQGTQPGGQVLQGEKNDILSFRVRLATGKRISALTSAPKNLRGLQGVVVIDEAAFHDQFEELLKAAMAFLMWGGSVVVISTHDGVDNPFNKICEAVRAGKRPGVLHRVPLQQAVQEGLYRRICRVLRRPWTEEGEQAWVAELYEHYGPGASEELDCVPAKQGSTYISVTLVESCMYTVPEGQCRVLRLSFDDEFSLMPEERRAAHIDEWCALELEGLLAELPEGAPHFLGFDFGRVSDLTVFAPATLRQDLVRHVPFLVELRNVPHVQQLQVLAFIADRLPLLSGIWADAGGNGSFLAEAAADRYGPSVVEQVKISGAWYAEHLPPFRAAFQDQLLSIPSDLDVRNDVADFRLEGGVPKLPASRSKGRDGKGRHGDAGIALLMVYSASRADDAQRYWAAVGGMGREELERVFGER